MNKTFYPKTKQNSTMKDLQTVHVGGRMNLPLHDIVMLKAVINYTIIYLQDGSSILSSTNLSKIGNRLKDLHFFQPNRSNIINLNFMKGFENETSQIEMQNDEAISLSRRKTLSFSKIIENYSIQNK